MTINGIVQYTSEFLPDILLFTQKPLFLYGSMVLLSTFVLSSELCTTVFMILYDWWLCMVINISVQYNDGFVPDIILLTQGYYHWGTRLSTTYLVDLYF